MSNEKFTPGQKVHYAPKFGNKENGIVKSMREDVVFVVFKCGNDWDNYQKYTGQSTKISDLEYGWVTDMNMIEDDSDLNGRPYDGYHTYNW